MARSDAIKKKLRIADIPQWQLAEAVGVHEQTLYRQLRQEITQERFDELSAAIDELEKGGSDE